MTADLRPPLDGLLLDDPDTFLRPDVDQLFARLRAEAPVAWQDERPRGSLEATGFWAVTRYADVMAASRAPDLFRSGSGTTIPDLPEHINRFLGSMINMDAPEHTRMRLIVNRGFTPRMIGRLEDGVRARARSIVDAVAPRGECDLVTAVAAELPLQVIADLLGVPQEDRSMLFDWTNKLLGSEDPEYVSTIDDVITAATEMSSYAGELADAKRARPADDIVSALVHAEIEGEALTTEEFNSFFILLVVAGNETTRNAITHGVAQLARHPDQRARLAADRSLLPAAVEEIVRWSSPVMMFRRTASSDTQLGGHPLAAGDKVVLYYRSANHDETVFDDPHEFDIGRAPQDHLGFGAGGPHFCLGANLARLEIRVMVGELLDRLPDLDLAGPPDTLRSTLINGVKHLPVRFSPAGA